MKSPIPYIKLGLIVIVTLPISLNVLMLAALTDQIKPIKEFINYLVDEDS